MMKFAYSSMLALSFLALAIHPSVAFAMAPQTDSIQDRPTPNPSSTSGASPAPEAAEETSEKRLEELLTLVSDNTLRIHKREMPAYWMLIEKVNQQPIAELMKEARSNVRFHDFYTAPSQHRGELVKLDLNVRRVIPYDVEGENRAGVKTLYEIWGWTNESKAWVYCCVTSELPKGFPTSGEVQQQASLVGYFFKLQAYQPGDAAPNAKPLVAPLLIARVDWSSEKVSETNSLGNWPLYLIAGFGVIIAFRMAMQFRSFSRVSRPRSMYRRRSLDPIDTEAIAISLREHLQEAPSSEPLPK